MQKSKIETYLGFCIRAGKIVFGTEMISRQKKGIKLLVVDGGIGANSLKEVLKAKERFNCPLVETEVGVLGQALHKPAVKVAAILDDSLASAIVKAVEDESQYKFYSGGNN